MELVKIKLKKIYDIGYQYVWDYKFFQNHINFTEEVSSGYIFDIIEYFNETIPLIDSYLKTESDSNVIFNTVGFLQIIYVQQDLTDELLKIFKIDNTLNEDRNPNRNIRNELIGHPISRTSREEGYKLKSSVFWGHELSKTKIHYVKYSVESNFKGVNCEFLSKDIINNHYNFLNKYFDKILSKLKEMLCIFEKIIDEIKIIEKKVNFERLIEIIDERYESFFKHKGIYDKDIILRIEQQKDTHPRYKFAVDLFKKELFEYIDNTKIWINKLLQNEEVKIENENNKAVTIIPVLVDSDNEKTVKDNVNINMKDSLRYLSEKHPIFGLTFFREHYHDKSVILSELDNMELNQYNEMEYYCSYEYIKSLIEDE